MQPVISDSESDDDIPLVRSKIVIVAAVLVNVMFFSFTATMHWVIIASKKVSRLQFFP